MSKPRHPDLQAARLFAALGDATRLWLVNQLRQIPQSATVLSEASPLTRQAIVKHLHVLEDARLIAGRREGREVIYAVDPVRLSEAQLFLQQISAGWDRAIDRLRDIVETPTPRVPRRRRG
jgi:DNA-binding transcriptional ArsR family regulator